MDYELTKHAQERMLERHISKKLLDNAILSPTKLLYNENDKLMFKKLYAKNKRLLIVVVERVKSVDSEISGNVVVDYDKKGKIAKINFYDFNFDNFKSNLKALKDFSRNREAALSVK